MKTINIKIINEKREFIDGYTGEKLTAEEFAARNKRGNGKKLKIKKSEAKI